MKKSEIYRKLQHIALNDDFYFDDDEKLEDIRELFEQEDLAKITEKQEADEA